MLQLITQQSIQILLNIRVSELIVPFTVDARSWTANLPVALTFILSLILGAVATEDCEFVRQGTMETKTVNLAGRIFSGSTTVAESETKVTSQLRLYTSYLYCFHNMGYGSRQLVKVLKYAVILDPRIEIHGLFRYISACCK